VAWIVLVVVIAIAALVLVGVVLALMRSAGTDSASVNEEYQEFLKSREQKTADEEAKEGHAPPDESPTTI
jgi:flagellar basal body-associated protein FliL